eukprot:2888837-Pleurochrysis_carterae.AAC.1
MAAARRCFSLAAAVAVVAAAAGEEAGKVPEPKELPGSGGLLYTWGDEFNDCQVVDPAIWDVEEGFVRNHELQWFDPNSATCSDGSL